MITTDIPVYARDGDIKRVSGVTFSNISKINTIPVEKPNSLILIKTASFGSILVSEDTCFMGGTSVKEAALFREITVNPNLEFGNKKIFEKFIDTMKSLKFGTATTWKHTPELLKYIKRLLDLNRTETRVALRYIKQLYEYKKNILAIKGTGHSEFIRCVQVMNWKLGIHSTYSVYNGTSSLVLKEDCPLTRIDYDKNQVISKIIELKYIKNISSKTKFYKIQSNDLPAIPTVAGIFLT